MNSQLNTTEIGDKFESKSLYIIRKVIEQGQLGHLANHLRIFSKKGYYSEKRKKDIKFDLTIEVWPPGAKRYVLIYIIECKNYETRVPVDDVEEFHNKIQQVSGVNVKGIFITNSPLQEGGFNIAESVGMMVIQGESSENFEIILHKTNCESLKSEIPIVKETLDVKLMDTEVKLLEQLIDKKILSVFNRNINNYTHYKIDKLSKIDIENLAIKELNKINPHILSKASLLSPKFLSQYIEEQLKVRIENLSASSDLLGSCNIKNNLICLHPSIIGTSRNLFILGHELGHYILHQKLSIGQIVYESFDDPEYNFRTNKYELKNPKHWIEWQANCFSASLVLPKLPFLARVYFCQDRLGMSHGKIYLDDQYVNRKNFNELVMKLAYLFNVSKTSVIYKLNEMELINDQSRLKSIGQIFNEYRDDLFT